MPPHRADIVTAWGGVVEIQHSPIPPVDVITEREEFYGEADGVDLRRHESGYHGPRGAPRCSSTARAAA